MKRAFTLLLLAMLAAVSAGMGYQIHPFSSDRLVHSDNGRLRYFFELPKGIDVLFDGSFAVDYEVSSSLSKQEASLTVMLNGQPVGSQDLTGGSGQVLHWQVHLPKQYFKSGFNELSIATHSHPTTGPCREDDDLRNWVRFKPSCLLVVMLPNEPTYPLTCYPFPYVNWLSQTATSVPLTVGPNPSDSTLSSALDLAAGFGLRLAGKPLEVLLNHTSTAAQAIRIGTTDELGAKQPAAAIAADNTGLTLSGTTGGQLESAVKTISNTVLTAQMQGTTSVAMNLNPGYQSSQARIGAVDFDELGYPSINLAGIGTQSTSIVLRRPIAAQLGRGGELHLRFHHASTLLKSRSLLSVTMNDQPIGNVALSPDNANDGELVCPIPVTLADSDEWNIQISAHNELANVDCSKNYDDVAWTVILGTSDFELKPGSLPATPYLEGFPYLRTRDGQLPDVLSVSLGQNPSDDLLTCAATIIATSAQSNRGATSWHATTNATTGDEDLIVGLATDTTRFQFLISKLPVAPTSNGFAVKNGLPILPSVLDGAVVIEAIPKKSGGVCYVVIGANDAALKAFTEYLSSLKGSGTLRGQVAVFSKDGQLFTFDETNTAQKRLAEDAEVHRYKPGMSGIMTAVVIGVVCFMLWIASRFVKRKPKTT